MCKIANLCCAAAMVGLLLCSTAARATTFDFSFASSVASGTDDVFTVTGTPGDYTITGVSGTVTEGANTYTITGLDRSFGDPDNKLSYPNSPALDYSGVTLDLSGGRYTQLNLYADDGSYELEYGSDYWSTCLTSFSLAPVAATPLPSTWALLLGGLGALGFLALRGRTGGTARGATA